MADIYHSRQGVRDIPDICLQHGITRVILCPGSRNASLILSFARYSSIECLSITDERSAGYFALGIAQYSQEPVAVVCTSGTAALNLAPSMAEAFYQHIPLVVFTADRPREWIDQADGQTIRQYKIFNNYCKASFEVPVKTTDSDDLWFFNRTISQAIDTAVQSPAGPVHINVPQREPLYGSLPDHNSNPRIIRSTRSLPVLSSKEIASFKTRWKKFGKKLIVFGVQHKIETLNSLAGQLAKRPDTAIIAENLSNISGPEIIYALEPFFASLNEDERKEFRPELLITVGVSIVSKRIKQFLRAYQPKEHWHISTFDDYADTFKCLTTIIKAEPAGFLNELNDTTPVKTFVYANLFREKKKVLALLHNNYISNAGFCDMKVMAEVLAATPEDGVVHLANSTPVRYAQLFQTRQDIIYYANRGTSGIDGCVSTAAGSAFASERPTLIITGDLAFIYDSNALWNNFLKPDLKVVVINNNGGSIFSLIESGSEIEEIRHFFETPHRVSIRSLAEAYGVRFIHCDDIADLKNCLTELFQAIGPVLLEIRTDQEQNIKAYKEYFHELKQTSA
ncbi:MAG: 2-succinyl-5-enolpyruvyl-6-hydroxy-3-cyclohexene-1-carboxylic-acid synthase [Bacteroidales bacterium]|nr:2-succinyl-5-enolpyruvyl-6-hydroxy-3-cyclohexene-1-carboxylic-acid synthase [Bacteroidales bacterium]